MAEFAVKAKAEWQADCVNSPICDCNEQHPEKKKEQSCYPRAHGDTESDLRPVERFCECEPFEHGLTGMIQRNWTLTSMKWLLLLLLFLVVIPAIVVIWSLLEGRNKIRERDELVKAIRKELEKVRDEIIEEIRSQ